jgi:hypothetical protein
MDPEDRDRLRDTFGKFKDLPKEKRLELREELKPLRDLPPEEKEQRRKEIYQRFFPKE